MKAGQACVRVCALSYQHMQVWSILALHKRSWSRTRSSSFLWNKIRFPFADEFDAYIIVSFVNATLVLSIGETVEEVTDSGFLGTTPTLSCSLLGEDALVQASTATWHVFTVLCQDCLNDSFTQFGFGKKKKNERVLDDSCLHARTKLLNPTLVTKYGVLINTVRSR